MKIIREIVSLDILRSMISIPKDFNYSKVEILILPIEDKSEMKTEDFKNIDVKLINPFQV